MAFPLSAALCSSQGPSRKHKGLLKRAQVPKDSRSPAGMLEAVLCSVLWMADKRLRSESWSSYKRPADKCTS